jgi:tetratricopeptide (TPR) repeat protein
MSRRAHKSQHVIPSIIPGWPVVTSGKLPEPSRNVDYIMLRNPFTAAANDERETQPTFQKYFDAGVSASEEGDWQRAAAAFARAVELRPNLFQGHFNLGAVYGNLGDDARAYRAFREAIRLHADDALTQFYFGFSAAMLGKVDEAVAALTRAERLKPELKDQWAKSWASAYYSIGYELTRQAKQEELRSPKVAVVTWSQAEKALSKAVTQDPEFVEAHFLLGVTYTHLGFISSEPSPEREELFDRALDAFGRATDADPEFASWSYAQMGEVWSRRGDQEKAIQLYEKAVELNPTNVPVLINLGVARLMTEKWDEAVEAFLRVIALNPGDSAAYHGLGAAYASKGDFGEAEAAFTEALRINPQNVGALLNLGVAAYNQGRLDEAEAIAHKVLEMAPGDETAANLLEELAADRIKQGQQLPSVSPVRRTQVKGWLTKDNMSPLGQTLVGIAEEIEDSEEPAFGEEDLERELTLRRGGYSPDAE